MSGAIFQKDPSTALPTTLEPHTKDITLTNVPLFPFALHATREVLVTGRLGILVDMATAAAPGSPQRATPTRPYFVAHRAEDIISWRTERRGGDEVLTRVVLRETVEAVDPKDTFKVTATQQYRVLELTADTNAYTQTLWRPKSETNKTEFEQFGEVLFVERRGKKLDFIPFVFIGATSVTPDIEKPPLLDLVDVNLSHYRTMADLEHGRHFTALPTPWIAGAKATGEGGEPLAIGSGTAWELDKEGRAGMLEFTGQGLGALEKADDQKRKMMATLGARLLEDQARSTETATAVVMRHAGEHASLRTVARSVEQGITIALQWHGWWIGTEARPVQVEAEFDLNKDFFAVRMSADELRGMVTALQADAISFETFHFNLQRGDLGRPGITVEEEQAEIRRQAGGPEPPGDDE